MRYEKEKIGDIEVLGFSLEELVELVDERLRRGEKRQTFMCLNTHSFIEAVKDPVFSDALKSAEFLAPDGIGIILASRILKNKIKKKIAGVEFFMEISRRWNAEGGRSYYFLGSDEKTLEKIRAKMKDKFPNIKIAGTYSPPFGEFTGDEDRAIVERINGSGPTALWVGMTAPKQEKWIYRNKEKLDVPFIGAVGAAFDFFAGTKKRAPQWAVDMGTEWLLRFLGDPKRMARRVFVSFPVFMCHVIRQKIRDA